MFDGEFESLKAIVATGTIKAPTPHLVVDNPAGGAVLVMEYLDMHGLNRQSGALGEQLARYLLEFWMLVYIPVNFELHNFSSVE